MRPFHNLDPRGPSEAACLRDPQERYVRLHGRRNRPDARLTQFEIARRTDLGQAFKLARLRKGIPQGHAAAALGMAQTHLSAWERGDRPIPPESVARLVALYDLDPADFAVSSAVTIDTADERDLLVAFRHLPEDERAALLALVRS